MLPALRQRCRVHGRTIGCTVAAAAAAAAAAVARPAHTKADAGFRPSSVGRPWAPAVSASAPLLLGFGAAAMDVSLEVSEASLAARGLRSGQETPDKLSSFRRGVIDWVKAQPAATQSPGGAALNSLRVAKWWGAGSRRRGCHSAAPPSSVSRCFNMGGEGMPAK